MEERENKRGSEGAEDDVREQQGDEAAKSKDRNASREAVKEEERTVSPHTEGEG